MNKSHIYRSVNNEFHHPTPTLFILRTVTLRVLKAFYHKQGKACNQQKQAFPKLLARSLFLSTVDKNL